MTSAARLAVVLLVAVSAACAASPWPGLESVEQFGGVFDADHGKTRVVLLLSPT